MSARASAASAGPGGIMDVYWLEQVQSEIPASDQWLSANELAHMRGLRFAKRRAEWRLGRWTAKRALAACLDLPGCPQSFAAIEIEHLASGAPLAVLNNRPLGFELSLSHREGMAVCAITMSEGEIGCDLESVEPRSEMFVADYFTVEEQALVAETPATLRPLLANLLWSGKESALKALGKGLRVDTRSVNVSLVSLGTAVAQIVGWRVLRAHTDEQVFYGWWRHTGDFVQTLVANPPPSSPILLKPVSYRSSIFSTAVSAAN